MQVFRHREQNAAVVGWRLRVMLLARHPVSEANPVARQLAGLGGQVEAEAEIYTALSAILDDPAGYGLFVMECDGLGGLAVGLRAAAMLTAAALRLPVLLISGECREQRFPDEICDPVVLRAPLSAVSLRVGFEHALRGRLAGQTRH